MLIGISARVRIPCGVPKKLNPVVVEITGFFFIYQCFAALSCVKETDFVSVLFDTVLGVLNTHFTTILRQLNQGSAP